MILAKLLDLFFPKLCLGCKETGGYVCEDCISVLLSLKGKSCCPSCRKFSFDGKFCSEKCEANFHFEQLVFFAEYKNDLLKKLIIKFKYNFLKDVSGILGGLLHRSLSARFKDFVLVPVPANRARINYRGYNQALLLAAELSKKSGLEVMDCLLRIGDLKQQATLKKAQRIENVKGSVSVKDEFEDSLKGKKILLIDDIATTCQTLNECSKVLKKAGVKYICALTLARKW